MSKHMHIPMVAVLLLMPVTVVAQPVQWEGNGHYYEVIDALGITWSDAKAEAEARMFEGLQGHLVVITSPEEQEFLTDTFSPGNVIGSRRLGGFQPEGSPEPDGGWTWVTGEPWEYTNWHGDGPNNAPNEKGQGEDTLVTWGTASGQWNDEHDVWGDCKGYVVEYELPLCIADINGDGVVGPIDLAMLLAAWGPCPEPPADCPADIHGEGDEIVQADDLATLLASWGPCP